MRSTPEIRVARVALPQAAVLGPEWCDLQKRGEHSFFMSWYWIGSWLAILPAELPRWLLRAEVAGRIVGLGVVCASPVRRHRVLASRGLYLHCTGRPELDELTVEYNGILAEQGLESQVTRRCIELLRDEGGWDELYLNGWHRLDLLGCLEAIPPLSLRSMVRLCPYVDLEELRRSGRAYAQSLSKSTRYNLQRSLRKYSAMGPLKFEVAGTPEEATSFLAGLKRLHQRSWQAKGQPGAFANRFFDEFHREFVRRHFADDVIQLARLRAGERDIGYLYNFVYRGHIYHYQSGIDYDIDSRLSPGLLCQDYAIEFNRNLGHRIYDFMAGREKYKSNLATHSTEMTWLVLQQPRLALRIENWLRARLRPRPKDRSRSLSSEGS